MYSIYSDSYLIYDSGIQDYVAMDPKLTLKANEAGQLTFTLPSTNPSISHITRLKSRIKVYRDSTLIFLGRIIEDSVSLDSKHVYRSYLPRYLLSVRPLVRIQHGAPESPENRHFFGASLFRFP